MLKRNSKMISYKNLFLLNGKNIIITGGAGILGKRFSEGVCEMGANLAIFEHKAKIREATVFAKKLSIKYKCKVIAIEVDVASEKSVYEAVKKAEKEFNQIHVLHNNAATKSDIPARFFASFEKYSLKEWQRIMDVNINGMFLMAQAVGKHMSKKNIKGSIIQTSSIYGITAPDQRIYKGSLYLNTQINTPAVYSVSKAGVVGLTKYLATYWAKKGIRVNTITPGGVESGQNNTFKNNYSQRVPLNRMGKDYEMVGALIFLASEASSYVTGQNIIVDGGLTVW